MSLRKNKAFRLVGYTLTGLAILSAVAHVGRRAMSGGWNDSYYSVGLVRWTYGAAFIVIGAAAVVGLIGIALYLQRRWRRRGAADENR
jgi:hypothetical protein